MQTKPREPVDEADIAALYKLIRNADISNEACRQLLERLGFAEVSDEQRKKSRYLERLQDTKVWRNFLNFLFPAMSPLGVFLSSVAAAVVGFDLAQMLPGSSTSPVTVGAGTGTFVLAMLAFLMGYRRWELAEKNRNVDDAIKRKELANQMIVDLAAVLLPYVGNVFDVERRYADTLLQDDERIKVQMWIFTEIDNLEYVFDKSRSGLIQTDYVLRAIKIFLSRSENDCFEREARDLVRIGCYNRRFVQCVEALLDVGFWARTRATRGPLGPTS